MRRGVIERNLQKKGDIENFRTLLISEFDLNTCGMFSCSHHLSVTEAIENGLDPTLACVTELVEANGLASDAPWRVPPHPNP